MWGSFQIEHRGRESTLQRPAGVGQRQGAGHTRSDRVGPKGEQRGDWVLWEQLLRLQ